MASPATREDIKDLAEIGRDQAEAMVRIAVRVEASEMERAGIRERIATIEATLRPVGVFFDAQNAAQAKAAADHIEADGRLRATASAWLSWLTPTRAALIITTILTLLPMIGLGTGLAGRLQRVVDALTATAENAPVEVDPEPEPEATDGR
jgi:hypothetical protein